MAVGTLPAVRDACVAVPMLLLSGPRAGLIRVDHRPSNRFHTVSRTECCGAVDALARQSGGGSEDRQVGLLLYSLPQSGLLYDRGLCARVQIAPDRETDSPNRRHAKRADCSGG